MGLRKATPNGLHLQSVVRALSSNTQLQILDISENGDIGEAGNDLAKVFKVNRTLQRLNTSNSKLHVWIWKNALRLNTTLTVFEFSGYITIFFPFFHFFRSFDPGHELEKLVATNLLLSQLPDSTPDATGKLLRARSPGILTTCVTSQHIAALSNLINRGI